MLVLTNWPVKSCQGPHVVQMSNSLYFTTHPAGQTQLPLKGSGGTEVTKRVAFNSPDRSCGPDLYLSL